jgi:photosystem II stability/assembly factor-like uncharacterized protein
MSNTAARYASKWATLGALFLAATAQSQDVCSGSDAIAGSVNSVLEAGARVFVLTADTPSHNGGGGLYISCDDGDSWYRHPMIGDSGNALMADPIDAMTIYAAIGGGLVYVSRDAGTSWVAKRPTETGNVSVTAFAISSIGQVLAGMQTGQLLQSIDYGDTWTAINESLPADKVHAILADTDNSNRLLVAVGNSGVLQSLDGGQSFSPGYLAGALLPPSYWPVRAIAFAPSDTSDVIAGSSSGLFRSVDGGSTFSGMAAIDSVVDIRFGGRDADTLFVVSEFGGLLRSVDGGQSFTTHKPDIPKATVGYRRAAQLNSGRLLIGTAVDGVYKSDDDGATWQIAGIEPPLPPPPPPPAEITAKLSITMENLNGGAPIEAGSRAQFRFVVKNIGPNASTDTYVRFSWFRPSVNGGISSKALELSSTSGSCAVGPNVEAGCAFGTLNVGQSVTITFSGTTTTDFIGSHSVTATASNAEGESSSVSGSVATVKSIACFGDCGDSSAGGGSCGLVLLSILTLLAGRRARSGSREF